jgi:hypothetical protein
MNLRAPRPDKPLKTAGWGMYRYALCLLIAAALAAVAQAVPPDAGPAGTQATAESVAPSDDYAVYVDFIRQTSWQRAEIEKTPVDAFVIMAKTDINDVGPSTLDQWQQYDYMKRQFPELDPSTLRSFGIRNAKAAQLLAKEFHDLTVVLLSRREIRKLFPRSALLTASWEGFYRRFPHAQGVLTFSCVGFSDDRRQALLYYGNQWDGLAGTGELLLLTWDGGRWVIARRMNVWVS